MKITGADELIRKLNKLGGSEAKKAVRKAVREGSKVILKEAKSTAPTKSGEFKRSIKYKQKSKKGKTTGRVSATVRYGSFVEFGTHKMAGKHTIEKAAEKVGGQALSVATDILKQEIEGIK